MRVSLEHLELFVPADCGDLGDVQALFEESRNRLMSQAARFPNQIFNDSWVVDFWRPDQW